MYVDRLTRVAIATYAAKELAQCDWHEHGKCAKTEERRAQWFRCAELLSNYDRKRIRETYLRF